MSSAGANLYFPFGWTQSQNLVSGFLSYHFKSQNKVLAVVAKYQFIFGKAPNPALLIAVVMYRTLSIISFN